jgi:hypothetical protein
LSERVRGQQMRFLVDYRGTSLIRNSPPP